MQEKSPSNKRRSSKDRLTGYAMVLTASALFGFNGNLSRLLFDGGVTPVTPVECLMLMTGLWRQNFSGLDRLGLLFASLSVLAFMAYLLLGRRVGRDMPSITATAYGALIAGAFWLCVQPPWVIPTSTWAPHRLLLIFLVGIVGMAIPFSLTLGSLRRLDATRVGIASMLELVSAGLIAYVWLGQSLDLLQITGGVLVMAGIISLQL